MRIILKSTLKDLWWTGTGFLLALWFPLPILIPPNASYSSVIWRLYNSSISGRRTPPYERNGGVYVVQILLVIYFICESGRNNSKFALYVVRISKYFDHEALDLRILAGLHVSAPWIWTSEFWNAVCLYECIYLCIIDVHLDSAWRAGCISFIFDIQELIHLWIFCL
jgi:hypothetical protein